LPGNHDGTDVGTPSEDLNNYNTYFPYSRFSGETWYGDAYNSINTNSFVLFSGGYDDYIIFNFQYHPSDAVLAWATATIDAYPDRRAIVVTHDYLNTDGSRTTEGNHIWNNFVASHADQIFLVLCGHMHAENRRTDTVNGHVVYQLLADFQEDPNGGNGWLRTLDFRPTEDKIYVKTYSPYLNQYQTDTNSQFTLDYDMTSDPPITITLQSPNNGTTTMDNMPDFNFTPTHPDSLTFNCSLWLQNATASYIYATKTNALNDSLTTVTPSTPITNGAWSWWINCTNGNTSAISEKRTITINIFRGDKTFTSSQDGTTRTYWLDLPDNFDNSTPTPLVVFLHGYGGNRLSYPQKYPTLRQTFQSNTWIVASVDCRTTSGYQNWYTEPSRRDITDVLNTIRNDYNIDSNHIHIMGNSMGGGGALKYAMFNTQVIASLVDICGITNFTQFYDDDTQNQFRESLRAAYGGTPTQAPTVYANESAYGNEPRFKYTPVMMLHGTADPTVSVSHSRNLNQSLNTLGYTVNYIEVPGAVHDANSLITGRELLILNWFKDHPLGVHALAPVNSPSVDYRWMDVADQAYSAEFQGSYDYAQATVHVSYATVGESLMGELVAQNLKPNFAYQLKLVGTPGTADNELIGLAGRWWQEEWNGTAWVNGQNLNNKGIGSSPNPNDVTYLARKSNADITSPTGLHYRYTGYLLFDYFITDSNGAAKLYFETGNCYHVLWKTSQRTRTTNDGPLKTVTFDPTLSTAYNIDYPSSTVSIFGEWERLPMGSVNLAGGNYNCQLVLTEESFHGTGPLEGNWAAAMSTNISFTIAP
jgi:acetyl esterase/lipase